MAGSDPCVKQSIHVWFLTTQFATILKLHLFFLDPRIFNINQEKGKREKQQHIFTKKQQIMKIWIGFSDRGILILFP
jgi:hypothetical protein